MKDNNPIKVTNELKCKLIPFAEQFRQIESRFYIDLANLEKEMAKASGIEDIEFFQGFEGDWVGIGNGGRTLPLIWLEDLHRLKKKKEKKNDKKQMGN